MRVHRFSNNGRFSQIIELLVQINNCGYVGIITKMKKNLFHSVTLMESAEIKITELLMDESLMQIGNKESSADGSQY